MLVTITEIKTRWKINPASVCRSIHGKRLPARRSGSTWLVEEDDVRGLYGEETPPQGWILATELAEIQGVTRSAVYQRIKSGTLPSVKAQGLLWVPKPTEG